VPDYVAMEIPLDKEQYSSNLNTNVKTSQDKDKDEDKGEGEKVEQSIMSRGLD